MSIKYLFIFIFFLSFIQNNSYPLKQIIQNQLLYNEKARNKEKVLEVNNIKRNLEQDNNDARFGEEEEDDKKEKSRMQNKEDENSKNDDDDDDDNDNDIQDILNLLNYYCL